MDDFEVRKGYSKDPDRETDMKFRTNNDVQIEDSKTAKRPQLRMSRDKTVVRDDFIDLNPTSGEKINIYQRGAKLPPINLNIRAEHRSSENRHTKNAGAQNVKCISDEEKKPVVARMHNQVDVVTSRQFDDLSKSHMEFETKTRNYTRAEIDAFRVRTNFTKDQDRLVKIKSRAKGYVQTENPKTTILPQLRISRDKTLLQDDSVDLYLTSSYERGTKLPPINLNVTKESCSSDNGHTQKAGSQNAKLESVKEKTLRSKPVIIPTHNQGEKPTNFVNKKSLVKGKVQTEDSKTTKRPQLRMNSDKTVVQDDCIDMNLTREEQKSSYHRGAKLSPINPNVITENRSPENGHSKNAGSQNTSLKLDTEMVLPFKTTTTSSQNISLAQKLNLLKPCTVLYKRMKVPANSIGVWKFGEENFFTTVRKRWTVSKCIAHVQNKLRRHRYGDLDLWVRNRCIMLDKKKSLSDYPGLKSLHVVRRPSSRNPDPLYQTSRADDIDPFCDDTCVGMPCGHASSPENLHGYVWQQIQNGATEVTCPAILDVNKSVEQCLKVWEFKLISMLACLSEYEKNLFCEKMFLNWLDKNPDVYLCPVCNVAIRSSCKRVFKCFNCEKDGKTHSFCIKCNYAVSGNTCYQQECQESLQKIRDRLKNCQKRTLVGVPNCPSVRACPVCSCVIEYDKEDSCKHMTCPRITCRAQFCFICLKVKTDKYFWPCGGAFQPCKPTAVQFI